MSESHVIAMATSVAEFSVQDELRPKKQFGVGQWFLFLCLLCLGGAGRECYEGHNQITRCHIPENNNVHNHHLENFKSHVMLFVSSVPPNKCLTVGYKGALLQYIWDCEKYMEMTLKWLNLAETCTVITA